MHYRPFTWRQHHKGQTVFVIGAGASAAEGAPTNQDLLKRALNRTKLNDTVRSDINDFLNDVWDYRVSKTDNMPTFEEVFTLVDLALSRERYFKGRKVSDLRTLRRRLLLAAATALTENLPANDPPTHNKFIQNLFSKRWSQITNRNTSFISFNYDTMLDRALIQNQKRIGMDIEYGCYFRNYDANYKEEDLIFDPARQGKELFLLKLHGSFNWVWCPVCNFAIAHGTNAGLEALKREPPRCPKCHGPLDTLLIPPTMVKTYSNPNLVNIWYAAEFLLSQAELIVFVGYSFSDADAEFKFMLRRAIAEHSKKPKIIVISDRAENRSEASGRYRRFFGKLLGKNDWKGIGFDGLADNPIHALHKN